jgi:hypothetical protein
MKPSLTLAISGLALALASTGTSAQTVVSQSVTAEPVETTVTQTPAGTIVTRRPLAEQPAPFVAPQPAGPVLAPATVPAATFVDTAPESVDTFTTRQVVRRAEAERTAPAMMTRQVSATRSVTRRAPVHHASRRVTAVRQAAPVARVSTSMRQGAPVHRVTRVTHETRRVSVTRPAPRLALNPRERRVVYQTIIEQQVVPRRQMIVAPVAATAPVVVAPQYVPAPPVVAPAVRAPILAADETVVAAPIAVGTVLPRNVPLFAMPQNVALTVPATQPYSYAWLGGRAYVVDPATGTVLANLSE